MHLNVSRATTKRLGIAVALLGAALVALLLTLSPHKQGVEHLTSFPANAVGTNNSSPAATNISVPAMPGTQSAPASGSFLHRPLPVSRESETSQWTAEDGKDTNVIRRIAHNDLEFERMVQENARIIRRQLVYRKETAAAIVQRARLIGSPVQQLTLPGLDGREVLFEITETELNPSGQQGAFAGRVVGQPDSLVTLAFKGGREAFTVIAPTEGLFLVAEPREPGEIIVKSIDPDVYASGYCGNP